MKQSNFAKIFDHPEIGQVLITLDGCDEDLPCVRLEARSESGGKITIECGAENEELARATFDDIETVDSPLIEHFANMVEVYQ